MKDRVQSSRCIKPWGFFILGGLAATSRIFVGLAITVSLVSCVMPADAHGEISQDMKRRQQGILTGMPFMANLAPRTFVDDLGRKLYLAKHPTRIVSLAPSITEMLFAIGLDQEIVGVTEFCDFPPAAREKPKVGYSQPNLEAVVALRPDLVLAPKSVLRVDLLTKLEQVKIPTFVLEPATLEDILAHIQLLGRMVGRTSESVREADRIRKQVAELTARLSGVPRPSILYVLNSEPLITAGPGSYIHHLIELAGGRNAAANADAPYPRLSMEEVLRQNPEILLFPVGRFEGIPQDQQDRWKQWTSLAAVQQNHLFQIDADLLNRPGPRIVQGLQQLVHVLHPDVRRIERPEP